MVEDGSREASTANTPNISNKKQRASKRWSEAVEKIQRKRLEINDVYGTTLTEAINNHSEFSFAGRSQIPRDSNFIFPPFLSKHNLDVLLDRLRHFFDAPSTRRDFVFDRLPSGPGPSKKRSLGFFLATYVALTLIATLSFHAAVVLGAKVIFSATLSVGYFLVDWDDLRNYCPSILLVVIEKTKQFLCIVDDVVLQGRRFAGREWNKDDLQWGIPSDAESWKASLNDFPPPTIEGAGRQNCLKAKFLERSQWGRATVMHHVGINFCYVMLQEDQLQRGARRKRGDNTKSRKHPKTDISPTRSLSPDAVFAKDDCRPENDTKTVPRSFPSTSDTRGLNQLRTIKSEEIRVGSPLPTLRNPSFDSGLLSPCLSETDDFQNSYDHRSVSSDVAGDMAWIDVGAKIGMRLLKSSHMQRAIALKDAKDRMDTGGENSNLDVSFAGFSDVASTIAGVVSETGAIVDPDKVSRPVHSMWTSPTAAAGNSFFASDVESDAGSVFSDSDLAATTEVVESVHSAGSNDFLKPPLSPRSASNRRKRIFRTRGGAISSSRSHETSRQIHEESLHLPEISTSPTRSSLKMRSSISASSGSHRGLSAGSGIECLLHEENKSTTRCIVRQPLERGVKVAVPMFPYQPSTHRSEGRSRCKHFQMGTVVSSQRILVHEGDSSDCTRYDTNALAVTVQLDRTFLRNGEFASLTFRVLDSWSSRYMPKHSKVPIGSCVSTAFGIGVLVGWRVEDDIHVVGSLWKRRGAGSARSYLNRKAIHGISKAAIGFRVQTRLGPGTVSAFTGDAVEFTAGLFTVSVDNERRADKKEVELEQAEIISCNGAHFMPVIEHIREAANFQLQKDNYDAAVRAKLILAGEQISRERILWDALSQCGEIFWQSFLRAVAEDKEFDEGVNEFMEDVISFLEKLDGSPDTTSKSNGVCIANDESIECVASPGFAVYEEAQRGQEPGFWIINDIMGNVFNDQTRDPQKGKSSKLEQKNDDGKTYERLFSIIHIIMKTVSISKASCTNHPHFRLALAISYDVLLFVRTLVKVQRRNVSSHSLSVWKRALSEIAETFGPIKDRMHRIGIGIAQRMEKQGRKAKIRTLKFVDTVLGDDGLLYALEQGDWTTCATKLESALVESEVIQEEHRVYYRKAIRFLNSQLDNQVTKRGGALERNNAKLALLIKFVQCAATPRRSLLKALQSENLLETFERILVRAFDKEERASRMLSIHASNFYSLRHFRMLKDFSTSGHLWIPLLDAADEEFSWIASQMPDNAKEFMCPLSSLFSLCVAQFHKIYHGSTNSDWLDFLFEEDAVRIIHDIDLKLIVAVESFSRDIKDMFSVVPYYPTIDDDILKLMDEVDMDEFLKEGFDAIDDPEKLANFVRGKTTLALERFLNYLPKMSIPVEKRDLSDGWVLTCHGEDGGDLTLSGVNIRRENLVCKVIGSELLYLPTTVAGTDDDTATPMAVTSSPSPIDPPIDCIEDSILDHIREMIVQAQGYGCWRVGVGGIEKPATDKNAAAVLKGLPISSVLDCAIELWRNEEMDEDELLEIAIRDVSYQIQVHESLGYAAETKVDSNISTSASDSTISPRDSSNSFDVNQNRFNPRKDPTVLYVEMNKLTLNLDNFSFRIEKNARTIFDPVFDGRGTLSIHNISIRLNVECAKERMSPSPSSEQYSNDPIFSPILKLREFEVNLERVGLEVKDMGFGSDWVLNRAVQVFESNITRTVEDNLKEQIQDQVQTTIQNLNNYFAANPNMLLSVLGVALDDLEESVVFV